MKNKPSKKRTSKGPVTDKTIIGSCFIILSGLILYLDKIFVLLKIQLANTHGYFDTSTYVWTITQTISPILIIIGVHTRANKYTYLVPLYCYAIQFWYVLDDKLTTDQPLLWIYVTGTVVLVVSIVYCINKIIEYKNKKRALKIKLMKEIINVDDKIIAKIDK